MRKREWVTLVVALVGPILWCSPAFAQQGPENTTGGTTVTTVQGPTTTNTSTTTTMTPYGMRQGGVDPDKGLPSSSREAGTGGFDLQGSGNTASVRGSKDGSYLITDHSIGTPQYHVVKRGDTLWDLCDHYFRNPYAWPRVWSYNAQVENPHWIYPGDRLRMRDAAPSDNAAVQQTANGFINRQSTVPPGTVFLRDRGYIDDESRDVWGELVGSPEDQMLMSDGDQVYLEVYGDREVKIGQEFTIFSGLRSPDAGDAKGSIVAIQGTAKVTQWDPKTRIARANLTESLDVIERGAKIGAIGRRFEVVPPVRNNREVWAKIAASVEPRSIVGQHQVVFIDKGSEDGLRPGNRLFAVVRGDRWRQSQVYGENMSASRVRFTQKGTELEATRAAPPDSKLPEEVIGEIRVLKTREHSSLCIVTATHLELDNGDVVVARRGY